MHGFAYAYPRGASASLIYNLLVDKINGNRPLFSIFSYFLIIFYFIISISLFPFIFPYFPYLSCLYVMNNCCLSFCEKNASIFIYLHTDSSLLYLSLKYVSLPSDIPIVLSCLFHSSP